MALTAPMLAQALLEYLREHEQAFESALLRRFDMDDLDGGHVTFSEDRANERLLVRVTRMGSGQSPLWESVFALKLEKLS